MSPWTHEGFKQTVLQAKVQVFSAAVNQSGGNYSYHQPMYAHHALGYVLIVSRNEKMRKHGGQTKKNNAQTLPDTTNTQKYGTFSHLLQRSKFNRCSISTNCVFIFQVFFVILNKINNGMNNKESSYRETLILLHPHETFQAFWSTKYLPKHRQNRKTTVVLSPRETRDTEHNWLVGTFFMLICHNPLNQRVSLLANEVRALSS